VKTEALGTAAKSANFKEEGIMEEKSGMLSRITLLARSATPSWWTFKRWVELMWFTKEESISKNRDLGNTKLC
jgi:hypothetical protein